MPYKSGYFSTYPGIVNSRQFGLGSFQDEERSQVGSIRGNDYHREASPNHSQHASWETTWCSFTQTFVPFLLEMLVFAKTKSRRFRDICQTWSWLVNKENLTFNIGFEKCKLMSALGIIYSSRSRKMYVTWKANILLSLVCQDVGFNETVKARAKIDVCPNSTYYMYHAESVTLTHEKHVFLRHFSAIVWCL